VSLRGSAGSWLRAGGVRLGVNAASAGGIFVVDHLCKEFLVIADSKVGKGSELLGVLSQTHHNFAQLCQSDFNF
jgi:hypothetical protein